MRQVVAFSGGSDSTALVHRLWELGEDFACLFTPTGNELPGVAESVRGTCAALGRELIEPPNRTLDFWIREFGALPNWRQRWCTRLIKVEPCVAWLRRNPGTVLCVGLRADEDTRVGLYGELATYRYPLKEWGWKRAEVRQYLASRGIRQSVSRRTDCAVCPYQRLGQWFLLWRDYPEEYALGEAYEAAVGYTFRSPGRDYWPAALKDLRAEFEKGRRPKGLASVERDGPSACRVCSL